MTDQSFLDNMTEWVLSRVTPKLDAARLAIEGMITSLGSRIDTVNADRLATEANLLARVKAIEDKIGAGPVVEPPPPPPPPPPPVDTDYSGVWANIKTIMKIVIDAPEPEEGEDPSPEYAAWQYALKRAYNTPWQQLADSNGKNKFLSDLNGQAAGEVVMGIIVAIRLNDKVLLAKVIQYLDAVKNTLWARPLELGRKQTGFMHAADLVKQWMEIDPTIQWPGEAAFREFMKVNIHRSLPKGHASHDTIYKGAKRQPMHNWGRMQRTACLSTGLYLRKWGTPEDQAMANDLIDMCLKAHKWDVGEPVELGYDLWVDPDFIGWYPEHPPTAGINRPGTWVMATRPDGSKVKFWVNGCNPGDFLRGSEDARQPPVKTGYGGEGTQALIISSVMLDINGLLPFDAGQNGTVRAAYFFYGIGEELQRNDPVFIDEFSGDDNGVNWLENTHGKLVGEWRLPEYNETSNFKGTAGAQLLSLARRAG